jgi:hypothetical protein
MQDTVISFPNQTSVPFKIVFLCNLKFAGAKFFNKKTSNVSSLALSRVNNMQIWLYQHPERLRML